MGTLARRPALPQAASLSSQLPGRLQADQSLCTSVQGDAASSPSRTPLASMIGPSANSAHEGELAKLRALVARLNLTGLANDTKWNEFLSAMRSKTVWVPPFRYRCIGSDFVSSWDVEWWYHVPLPMISVAWLELRHSEPDGRLPPGQVDHSQELAGLLDRIGLDYIIGDHAIRIFGYSPRDTTEIPP